jgi:ABC-type multidrug transport system fused ATPase/permease subunit
MEGRTVILVSHHVQMCASGAGYIVALDNGRVQFCGSQEDFHKSGVIRTLIQSIQYEATNDKAENVSEETVEQLETSVTETEERSESSSTVAASVKQDKKPARKLVEEEKRAVGRIGRDIWNSYIWACGRAWYWVGFTAVLLLASLSPVLENGWLRYFDFVRGLCRRTYNMFRYWSNAELNGTVESPGYYITVYAVLSSLGLFIGTFRWFVLYRGSIRASHVLYKRLLEAVLFANIRFHDTVSRGRLLNRFGKDFEGIDSSLSDNFGRSIMYGLSAATTIITVSVVGGLPFICAVIILGIIYWNGNIRSLLFG